MAQKEKFIDLDEESVFGDNNNKNNKKDFDGVDYDEEEDFERNIDNDLQNVNEEELANNLLFQVQSLGRIEHMNNDQQFYMKGDDCMDAIKDLIRACKSDDPEEMITRRILGKWNIVKADLIQLLLSQHEDRLLSFYLIHLLYYLTESPSLQTKNREQLIGYLRCYKENFLQHGVVTTLVMHLEQCVKYEGKEKKAKNNMIIAIIGLFRNLLQISDLPDDTFGSNEIQKNLQKKLLITFINEGALDALQYLASDFTSSYNEHNIYDYIEIFYHVFASISIDWLLDTEKEESRVVRLLRQENEKIKQQTQIQGKRHTRFMSNTMSFTRQFDKTKKLIVDPTVKREDVINSGGKNILKKPQPRKIMFQHVSIFRKQINTDCCIKEEENEETQEIEKHYLKEHLFNYIQTFLEHSFSPLMNKAYEELMRVENESDKPEHFEETKVQYYVILQFFMQFVRKKYLIEKKTDQSVKLDISDLILCVELTQFELLYKYMLEETTKRKKASFNFRVFHALTVTFLELINLVTEMKNSNDSRNRQNATIICNNIFSYEITKILEVGFDYQILGILNDQMLKTLAEIIGPYFLLLEKHSKGKIFTVTTNKRLRAKKNKKKQMQHNQEQDDELKEFIEKDKNQDNDEDGDYDPEKANKQENNNNQGDEDQENNQEQDNQEVDEEEAEQTTQYQEVSMNINTVFAGIVQYKNLSKIMYLIKNEKILSNSEALNLSIFEYINRIVNKLQADFMFFQIEYLEIINKILNNNRITSKMYVKQNLIFTLKKIVKNYFTLLKKNQFLIVESFFRFQTKDDVMAIQNNYEELEGQGGLEDDNLDIGEFASDQDQDDDDHMGVTGYKKRWCQAEDRALVENFDIFKDQDECFEKLEEMLNNLGFYQKRPQDIRKRVKKLKLDEGQDIAKDEMKKIYNSRLTLEQSVKLLRRNINPTHFEMDDVKNFFNNLFTNYLQYLIDFPQDQYNARDNIMGSDYAIVPIRKLDFDILCHDLVIQIMECMDFRPPQQGEWAWRIPVFVREVDAKLYQEKIIQYFEMELPQQQIEEIQQNQNIIDQIELQNEKLRMQKELENLQNIKKFDENGENEEGQEEEFMENNNQNQKKQGFEEEEEEEEEGQQEEQFEENSQKIYEVSQKQIQQKVDDIFDSNENSQF